MRSQPLVPMSQKSAKRTPPKPAAPSRKEKPVPLRPQGTGDLPPDGKPTWLLSRLDLDHDGSWSWNLATGARLREIAGFLGTMENLTWAELQTQTYSGNRSGTHRKNKFVPIENVCPEAQRRLRELKLDHLDEFRLSGKPRLWGYPREGAFYLVWWDPDQVEGLPSGAGITTDFGRRPSRSLA